MEDDPGAVRPGMYAKHYKSRRAIDSNSGATTMPTEASERIDQRIRTLADWRGAALAQVRRLIHEADPNIVEEVKWVKPNNPMGVPTWSHSGIVCTGETYQDKVKLTFARGAALEDPSGLFNSGFAGGTRRAIDIRDGDAVDKTAFTALIREAVAANLAHQK
jgi:hypothetical protein